MRQPILIIFVCGLVLVGLGKFLLFPKYQEYAKLTSNKSILQKNLTDANTYYDESEKRYDKMKRESKTALGRIDTALPSEISKAELFSHFQKLVEDSGSSLDSIAMGKPEVLANNNSAKNVGVGAYTISSYNVNMSISGIYSGLKTFFNLAERSTRLIDVNTFDFSSTDNPVTPIKFNVQGKIYSMK